MALFKGKYRIESARLKGWDYASPGWYFVTICTRQMEPFFGDVVDGEMQLSPVGKAARAFWAEIPDHHPNVELDEYVIMPNHMHGIVVIKEPAVETPPTANVETPPTVETRYIASLQRPDSASAAKSRGRSLSVIIGTYKAAVTRWAGSSTTLSTTRHNGKSTATIPPICRRKESHVVRGPHPNPPP